MYSEVSWCVLRTSFLRPTQGKEQDPELGLEKRENSKPKGRQKHGRCMGCWFFFCLSCSSTTWTSWEAKRRTVSHSPQLRDCSLQEPKYFHVTGAFIAFRVKFRSSEPENFERPTIAERPTSAFPPGGHLLVCLLICLFLHQLTVKLVLE